MRILSSSFTCFSLARSRFRILLRSTRNLPFFRACPQMWVKPRKLNDSGLPSPCFFRLTAAKRPNSIRRVLSGCSPARTSADVPSIPEETVPHRRDTGIPEHYRRHNGPLLPLLWPDASASAVPKDRKRNVGKRCRAAVKSPRPVESPPPSSTTLHPRILQPSATS